MGSYFRLCNPTQYSSGEFTTHKFNWTSGAGWLAGSQPTSTSRPFGRIKFSSYGSLHTFSVLLSRQDYNVSGSTNPYGAGPKLISPHSYSRVVSEKNAALPR